MKKFTVQHRKKCNIFHAKLPMNFNKYFQVMNDNQLTFIAKHRVFFSQVGKFNKFYMYFRDIENVEKLGK